MNYENLFNDIKANWNGLKEKDKRAVKKAFFKAFSPSTIQFGYHHIPFYPGVYVDARGIDWHVMSARQFIEYLADILAG